MARGPRQHGRTHKRALRAPLRFTPPRADRLACPHRHSAGLHYRASGPTSPAGVSGVCRMKRRLLLITEIISPYRIPVFNVLAAHPEIDLHVLFLSETDPSLRQWN